MNKNLFSLLIYVALFFGAFALFYLLNMIWNSFDYDTGVRPVAAASAFVFARFIIKIIIDLKSQIKLKTLIINRMQRSELRPIGT